MLNEYFSALRFIRNYFLLTVIKIIKILQFFDDKKILYIIV